MGTIGPRDPITSTPMELPQDLLYSDKHEWVRRDGDQVRIGITDYAQDALGDIVFVDIIATGTAVAFDETLGEVESTKSVSDIYSPVQGTVIEVNESLGSTPELVNSDPYGEGWIAVLEIGADADLGELMDAAAYSALLDGE